MLILEIILTIVAWNRGWKWLALIPLGVAFGIGLILGSTGNFSVDDAGSLIWIDVVAIIALIVMIAKKKDQKDLPEKNS